jgi:hypothetical protein
MIWILNLSMKLDPFQHIISSEKCHGRTNKGEKDLNFHPAFSTANIHDDRSIINFLKT